MEKREFYDSETHFRQEAKSNPYSEIGIHPPEFTPVDPDISYFLESSVTMHEETVYAGETPPGEAPLRDAKEEREKRRKRSQAYSWVSISLNGSIVSYSINAAYASLMEGYSAVLLVDGEMLMESSGRTGSFDVAGWPAGTTLRIWVLSWAESDEYATSSRTLVTTENYG